MLQQDNGRNDRGIAIIYSPECEARSPMIGGQGVDNKARRGQLKWASL